MTTGVNVNVAEIKQSCYKYHILSPSPFQAHSLVDSRKQSLQFDTK